MEYIINDKIKLIYNDCDNLYIKEVIQYFNDNYNNIMNCFNLDSLDKRLIIKLWADNESFLKNMSLLLGIKLEEIPSWAIGFGINERTDSTSQIHYLSLKEIRKIDYHKNNTIDDLKKGLVHEFVHICHSQFCNYCYPQKLWITEGIATYLSNQYPNAKSSVDLKTILNDDYVEYQNYRYIFDVIFKVLPKEEIQKILKEQINASIYKTIENYNNYYQEGNL